MLHLWQAKYPSWFHDKHRISPVSIRPSPVYGTVRSPMTRLTKFGLGIHVTCATFTLNISLVWQHFDRLKHVVASQQLKINLFEVLRLVGKSSASSGYFSQQFVHQNYRKRHCLYASRNSGLRISIIVDMNVRLLPGQMRKAWPYR